MKGKIDVIMYEYNDIRKNDGEGIRMNRFNRKSIILANICKFFCGRLSLIQKEFIKIADKLMLNAIDANAYGYVGLGPTDDAENVSEYLRAMEWATNDTILISFL